MKRMHTRLATGLLACLFLLTTSGLSLANQHQADYSRAQFVMVMLGETNTEQGVHLVQGHPDGLTEPVKEGGRRSMPGSGRERWFYFDVHNSYIHGGINKVVLTISYEDKGLTPIILEYDSMDTVRPDSMDDAVTKKRVVIANRTNSQAVRTARVELEDARFLDGQPGPADFRIGSTDELIIRSVSVLRLAHQKPQPPIRVVLDGEEVIFDVPPYLDPKTGRVLVPMRMLFNALGVPNEHIYYNPTARTVTAVKGQTTLMLTIDSDKALVNGREMTLDQPAVIMQNRTLVPLRFVSQQFGLFVHWNQDLRVVTMTSPQPASPPASGGEPTEEAGQAAQPGDEGEAQGGTEPAGQAESGSLLPIDLGGGSEPVSP